MCTRNDFAEILEQHISIHISNWTVRHNATPKATYNPRPNTKDIKDHRENRVLTRPSSSNGYVGANCGSSPPE